LSTKIYDQAFFDQIRPGVQRSAKALVPLLVELVGGQLGFSMIDVGCGEGWWAQEFEAWDFEVCGVESHHVRHPYTIHDLEQPLPDLGRFGLALCLEVAEHLTPERAPSFVTDLCRLSDLVVFSAAIPGQRGVGHLNEQWPSYWIELFGVHGYSCSDTVRRLIWDDKRIEWWYRQNLLVFTKDGARLPNRVSAPSLFVLDVVHPELWKMRQSG
jgi:hypothetical protein